MRDGEYCLQVLDDRNRKLPELVVGQHTYVVAEPNQPYVLYVEAPAATAGLRRRRGVKLLNSARVTIDGVDLPHQYRFSTSKEIVGYGLGVGKGHRAFTFSKPRTVVDLVDDDEPDSKRFLDSIGTISVSFEVVAKERYYIPFNTRGGRRRGNYQQIPAQSAVAVTESSSKFWENSLTTKPGEIIPPSERELERAAQDGICERRGPGGEVLLEQERVRFETVQTCATLKIRYASFEALLCLNLIDMLNVEHFSLIPRSHFQHAPYTFVTCIAAIITKHGNPSLTFKDIETFFSRYTGYNWKDLHALSIKVFIGSNFRYFDLTGDEQVILKPNTVGAVAATAAFSVVSSADMTGATRQHNVTPGSGSAASRGKRGIQNNVRDSAGAQKRSRIRSDETAPASGVLSNSSRPSLTSSTAGNIDLSEDAADADEVTVVSATRYAPVFPVQDGTASSYEEMTSTVSIASVDASAAFHRRVQLIAVDEDTPMPPAEHIPSVAVVSAPNNLQRPLTYYNDDTLM